jgi:hypothetical protein
MVNHFFKQAYVFFSAATNGGPFSVKGSEKANLLFFLLG